MYISDNFSHDYICNDIYTDLHTKNELNKQSVPTACVYYFNNGTAMYANSPMSPDMPGELTKFVFDLLYDNAKFLLFWFNDLMSCSYDESNDVLC